MLLSSGVVQVRLWEGNQSRERSDLRSHNTRQAIMKRQAGHDGERNAPHDTQAQAQAQADKPKNPLTGKLKGSRSATMSPT